jgi:hypothetical protein
MQLGRPTDYTDDMPAKVHAFTTEAVESGICPTVAGVARILGVSIDAIEDWRKKHEDFGGAIKRLLATQQDMLQLGGLTNKWNPTMSIFLLKNNHGFKDSTSIDHTTKGKEIPNKLIIEVINGTTQNKSDDGLLEEQTIQEEIRS